MRISFTKNELKSILLGSGNSYVEVPDVFPLDPNTDWVMGYKHWQTAEQKIYKALKGDYSFEEVDHE